MSRIRLAKRWIASLLHHSGGLSVLNSVLDRVGSATQATRAKRNACIQILCFHRIGSANDGLLPSLPLGVFERQMDYLARRGGVLDLSEAVRILGREAPARDGVVLTFDDGYRDNYVHAFPVLRRFGLPATVFLTTGALEGGEILWHDRVFYAFSETKESSVPGVNPASRPIDLSTPVRKDRARTETLRYLKRLGEAERAGRIEDLLEQLGVDVPPVFDGLMLRWDDIRAMRDGGISFGAHTVTHPVLSKLSRRRVSEEIERSKGEIERQLGTPVTAFAYPNGGAGDFDDTTKNVLREHGFSTALTTIHGSNTLSSQGASPDMLELRRLGFNHTHLAAFVTALTHDRFRARWRTVAGPSRKESVREGA